jgi:chromosome partitioning protein
MFTISLLGQKGGTGKTTISVGLSVAAALAGHPVAIIDLDPQATATKWKGRRSEDSPAVVSAQASRLQSTLATADASGVEFAIIDSAGRSDDSALAAARAADLVLIPTRTSIVELETLPQVNDLLRLAHTKSAMVVLNGIHPSAGASSIADTTEVLQKLYGLSTCPVHLCQRIAYAEAMVTGSTPQERDPEGKAGQELNDLFRFVREAVNNRTVELERRIRGVEAALGAFKALLPQKIPAREQLKL